MEDTALSAISLTESVAIYMNSYFQQLIHESNTLIHVPGEWSSCMLYECHQAVRIMKEAFNNQSKYLFLFYSWLNSR